MNDVFGPQPTGASAEPKHAVHSEHKDASWKTRAPYVFREVPQDQVAYEGACHCGRVQYVLTREKSLASKYCHCTTCQRLHAAPFQWSAIFKKEDLVFTKGLESLVWYNEAERTIEQKLPCKISCGYCRTPIMDEGRNMLLIFPTLFDFDKCRYGRNKGRQNMAPMLHMFYPSRVMDILDKLPKYKGLDGSELCEGSPPIIPRPDPSETGPGAGKLSSEAADESHAANKGTAPSDADQVKPPPPPSPPPAQEAHAPGERSDTAPFKKHKTMTGDAEEHQGGERRAGKATATATETEQNEQRQQSEKSQKDEEVEKQGKEDVKPASDTKVAGIL